MQKPGDQELVGRAVRGDEKAFQTLYHTYHPQVRNVVTRRIRDWDDQQDLVQTAFVRAFRNLHSFRADAAFSTWLVRIAINACNSHVKSWWMRRVSLDQMEDPDSYLHSVAGQPGEDAEDAVYRQEVKELVQSQVKSLPDPYRQPMWMRHVEDLSYVEISCRLGLPMGTVKTHLFRGFQSLRGRMKREESMN